MRVLRTPQPNPLPVRGGGGQSHPGKRARLRDMGLWAVDPPEYYQGSFVTVDLFGTPEARLG